MRRRKHHARDARRVDVGSACVDIGPSPKTKVLVFLILCVCSVTDFSWSIGVCVCVCVCVCLSLCLSVAVGHVLSPVGHVHGPCKNGWTAPYAVCRLTRVGHYEMRVEVGRNRSPPRVLTRWRYDLSSEFFLTSCDYLARAACMPRGLALISFFPLIYIWAKRTQDLMTDFYQISPYSTYLVVDCWLAPFSDGSRDIAMATDSRVKIGKIELYSPLFVALAFRKGLHYGHSDFLKVHLRWSAIFSVNLVNFGPVTP